MNKLDDIKNLVEKRTLAQARVDVSDFVRAISERYGDKLLGVFMYGSMLSQVTASSSSFPDFFVITQGYSGVFDDWRHHASAYPLPPHIYHLKLPDGRRSKYNLVSMSRFRQETSQWASDIYILGRFGKRVSLVWHKDEQSRDALVQCCFNAMCNVAVWTLRGMDAKFDDMQFTLACLNISYAGETRIEARSKVSRLFESERELYTTVYPGMLREHPVCRQMVQPAGEGKWRPRGSQFTLWARKQAFELFLKSSRIRGIMRWPKFLLTVEDWVDIILAKIERTKGIDLHPPEYARRYPLVFGWPYFFRLLKDGAIGSFKTPPKN